MLMKQLTLFICGLLCLQSAQAANPTSKSPPKVVACKTAGYVIDKDPKGLNIRSAPSSKSRVLKQLPGIQKTELLVDISGSLGNWLRISYVENAEGQPVFKGSGWVYAPLIGTSVGQEWAYHQAKSPVLMGKVTPHAKAAPQPLTLPKVRDTLTLPFASCKGTWIQVQQPPKKAWLTQAQHCPNPLTTCP